MDKKIMLISLLVIISQVSSGLVVLAYNQEFDTSLDETLLKVDDTDLLKKQVLYHEQVIEEIPKRNPYTFTLFYDSDSSEGIKQDAPAAISQIYADYIRWREVQIRQEIFDISNLNKNDLIELNLFDDEITLGKIDNVYTNVLNVNTIYGSLIDYVYGNFIITINEDDCLVTIEIPEEDKLFTIQFNEENNIHYLVENILSLNQPDSYSEPLINEDEGRDGHPNNYSPLNGDDDQTPVTIDIMIVYTTAAKNAVGGLSGINSRISQAIAKSNLVLSNSDTYTSFSLVHAAEVDYTESGSSHTDLSRLSNPSDGYMDEVHDWRDMYGADLVQLFTETLDNAGMASSLGNSGGSPGVAFSITKVSYATGYTPIHEFGHTMGCGHHKQQNFQPGPGLFSYSAGWRWATGGRYCTVMTYSSGNYFPDGNTHSHVAYFSNPDVNYNGQPTGHPADGDNARTIREMRYALAAYRGAEVTRPPRIPHYPSPADNINNRDLGVNLIWSAGHPDCFWWIPELTNVSYDIYFGTSNNPDKIDTIGPYPGGQYDITYNLNENDIYVDYDTTYYWKIIAYDDHGGEAEGALWSFTTCSNSEKQLDQHQIQSERNIRIRSNAQSFKPSRNTLSKIGFYLKKEGSPDTDLRLYICNDNSGKPDITNSLTSVTVSPEYIDREFSWIEFNIPNLILNPAETYYIILDSEENIYNYYEYSDVYNYPDNPYPHGDLWSINNNGEWYKILYHDSCFKTYGFKSVVDQYQEIYDHNYLIYYNITKLDGEQYEEVIIAAAQSFIYNNASANYTHLELYLRLQKSYAYDDLLIELRENSQDGDLIGSAVVSQESIGLNYKWIPINFGDITLNQGVEYFIVAQLSERERFVVYEWGYSDSNSYENGSFWSSIDGGTTWDNDPSKDFCFRIYVEDKSLNEPPYIPSNPTPDYMYSNSNIDTKIGWSGGDPNYDTVTYDVYFGTESNPPKIDTIGPFQGYQSNISYDLGLLTCLTTYYWKIVANDAHGTVSAGPVWQFTTNNIDIDQQQIVYNKGFRIFSGRYLTQEFVPSVSVLSRVDIYMDKMGNNEVSPEGPIIFEIRKNDVNGEMIYTDVINETSVVFFPAKDWITINIPNISLDIGETYVIMLKNNVDVCPHIVIQAYFSETNLYHNGSFYYTTNGGKSWNIEEDKDLCFKTYGIKNESETYIITASADNGGNINPSGTVAVNQGTDKTFTITPNIGYHITDVIVDGISQGAKTSYTFNNIDDDHTIEAKFAINQYILTINLQGPGMVTKDPDETAYNHGEEVTLTATPNDNSHIFHHWNGDLTGYQDTVIITMDSDKTITANFTLRGDVNCDGLVGAADITYVQEIMFGNLEEIPAADVNQDGNINIEDIQTIEQIFLGYALI